VLRGHDSVEPLALHSEHHSTRDLYVRRLYLYFIALKGQEKPQDPAQSLAAASAELASSAAAHRELEAEIG
jgi:hypothetical protein